MVHTTAASINQQYQARYAKSAELYAQGCDVFPSGVTHDGRYLTPFPVYIESSAGSKKYSVEGHEIVDCWSGHGSLLLGHGHPDVVDAVQQQVGRGTHWSACHELELQWAERVRTLIPSAEKVRFTASGTEATLMALRLARIFSGRSKVLKFSGHFHGWHDQLSPAADPPHDDPDYPTPGVTEAVSGDLVVIPPNDLDALEQAVSQHQPACVILEPTGGRWGVVPIRGAFLQGVRDITRRHGVLMICDEVISGFRVSPGGAQAHYNVTPDLTTLAKVLAGGLPGGCLTGRADVLDVLTFGNPLGQKMKHPGTFNGNPLSAVAGIAALDVVATGEPCDAANRISSDIRGALNDVFQSKSARWVAYGDFSAVKIHADYDGPAPTGDDFVPFDGDFTKLDCQRDADLSHAFRCALLIDGVDWMGWHGMISAAHDGQDVDRIASAFANMIDRLRAQGLTA